MTAIHVKVVAGADRGQSLTSTSDTLSIGTARDNDLVLTDETVSRYHVELVRVSGRLVVRDLGSTNGVMVGKARVRDADLLAGAQIRLGSSVLRVDNGNPISVPLHETDDFFGMRGRSASVRRLMAQLERASRTDVSVLLLGETGVGKEVAAQALHQASRRREQPFETVDGGALAPTLINSELFGHEKGSFTGADRQHIGAFERAHGGTLFIDEIGELPASIQRSLLGVLERKAFRRIGSDRLIPTDVRLVCATNRDLRSEVNAGNFREDLYFRIAVVRLQISPLRERKEDIPNLVEHFLREMGHMGAAKDIIPDETMASLAEYRWPGNLRELRNFVEATFAMGESPALERTASVAEPQPVWDLGLFSQRMSEHLEKKFAEVRSLVLAEFEILYLEELLKRAEGNVSKAARMAEIHRTYLIKMLKRHKIK